MDMKNESRNKNILIGALVAVVLIMGVGYAAFAQQLTINGNAEITSRWDVHIEDITPGTPVGTATNVSAEVESPSVASFTTNLVSPGDSLTYTVVVKNGGTLPAKVSENGITFTQGNTDAITYTYSGIAEGDIISAEEGQNTKEFTVTVTYNSTVTTQPATEALTNTLTMLLDFEQAK